MPTKVHVAAITVPVIVGASGAAGAGYGVTAAPIFVDVSNRQRNQPKKVGR